MANRNVELGRLNSDLVNLQTSTRQAIVLVGRDLSIRRFSAQAERQFGLLATDIGRPFSSVRHNLVFEEGTSDDASALTSHAEQLREQTAKRRSRDLPDSQPRSSDIAALVAEVIDTVRENEREARDKDGRYFSLRIRPYLTLDSKVDGAVLVLVDIDDLRRGEQRIATARDYAESIIRASRDPILVLTEELRVENANEAFHARFRIPSPELKGTPLFELGNGQWNIPELRGLLEAVRDRDSVFDNFEVTHDFPSIGRRTMLLSARPLGTSKETQERILLGIQDVTEMLQFQAAMRASQARYKALIEASSQIVWTTGADGAASEDSPSWRDFTGQTFEQWRGFGWQDAIHPEDRESARELWRQSVAERAPVETEYRLKRADGQWRWTTVRALPVLDSDGSVSEWVGMNTDITERKEAEQKLRIAAAFDEATMANMSEGLYTVDGEGLVTSMNPAAEELFGWSLTELRGRRMHDVTHHHYPDGTPFPAEHCADFQVLKTGASVLECPDTFIRKDGTFFDVVYSAAALQSEAGVLMGLVVVFRDVTSRKKSDDERKRLEAELAKRVEELATIDAARDRFLAVLSHELRSPLNAILSWAQIMKRPGASAEDVRRAVDVIERNSKLQSQLIDELLDAHRIGTGKARLQLKRIDLVDSVEAAAASIEPVAQENGIRLERDIEPGPTWVLADSGRLQQVLGNLLTNAMKFTPRGGLVRVGLRRSGSSGIVSVADSGEGISGEAMPFIFEAFRQADSSASRSHGGLGLGLSVAKQIMGLHGGSIEASSEGRGKGTTFTATMPLRGVDEESRPVLAEGSEAGASDTLAGIMVLVVDDEPDSREPVRRVLEDAGAEVIAVSSATEALMALREQRPDVLVSDLAMPGKDGFELLRSIRSLPPGRGGRIPAVALTGLGGQKERDMALEAGFARHLTKPVEPSNLVSVVAELAHSENSEQRY